MIPDDCVICGGCGNLGSNCICRLKASEKNVVVSLFDLTGEMVKPWLEAGYQCYIVDIQHPVSYETGGITKDGDLFKVHANLLMPWLAPVDKKRIAFVAAFPPCDHMAVSGARWFKGKGLRRLSESIAMFATAADFCEWSEAPYQIENPVSTISSYWRKPDYTYHPWFFNGLCQNDNYTKKTCLWVGGGFVMPDPVINRDMPDPDDRIHKCPPSAERANIRSATPAGYAEAVFQANGKKLEHAFIN